MDFIKPEYKRVYSKLSTNNNLIKYLTEIGTLITTDDYYELYGPKSKIDPKIYVSKINKAILESLAEFFLTNEKAIKNNTITALVTSKGQAELRQELKILLGFDADAQIPFSVYREIFYTYKNSYVDNFFQNNWRNFIPEADEVELDNNEIASSFIDAITKEFDKIDEIISDTKKFRSYEEIPEEYINHLSQLLGLEQKSFYIDNSQIAEFRVLAANIIEIYKTKGTFAAFELMFKLFGFDISIEQYYFDRRFYFAINDENKETITLNKNSYKYYLTTTSPTLNSMDKFELNEIVTDKDMTDRYSVEEFDRLVDTYGLECVLGYEEYYNVYYDNDEGIKTKIKKSVKYTGNVYKYFKTNYVKVRPRVMGNKSNLSSTQTRTIRALLKFLVPYFWKMNLVVNPIFDEDAEKLTVNGHRGTHDEDGVTVNDEGFRLLDSETWIYKDETLNNKYNDPNTSAYEKFQIKNILEDEEKRLKEITRDFTLYYDYCDDYVIVRDNDIIFADTEFNQDYQSFKDRYIKNHEEYTDEDIEKAYISYKRTFTKVTNADGRRYWVKDLVKADGTVREERVYFNSLGERNGDRLHVEGDNIISYNVIMEPIGKKIITINSTKYWGKVFDINSDKSKSPVYPIWTEDYKPVQETNNSKERYFYPAVVGETHLYIPKYESKDLSEQWKNIKQEDLDLIGFEGNTLKQNFLNGNNRVKIDWLADGADLYTAIANKLIRSNNTPSNFFEKEPKKVSNMRWKKCNITLLKDKEKIISLEKEVWNILNSLNIKINDINEKTIEEIKKTNITTNDLEVITKNIDKIKKLNKSILLEDFVKTHKVINYDYTKKKLLTAPEFGEFDINKNMFKYKSSLYNDMYFQNVYCVKDWEDGYVSVYKLVSEKNSEFNKLYFKKIVNWKEHYNVRYEIEDAKSLVYVDTEDDIDENHSLLIKDGKVYYVVKEDNSFKYSPVNVGTIFYSKDDDSNYIAIMGTTKNISTINTIQEVNPDSLPNELTEFGLVLENDNIMNLYQNSYKNIKEGQLIYMPQTGKLYELMFNGYHLETNNKYFSLEKQYNIICNEAVEDNFFVERDYERQFVFGIKEKQLTGTIVKAEDGYYVVEHDEYYKGPSEQDDNDNYILNNYERIAEWSILDGCNTDYLKDNHIDRPIREITDGVFDSALVGNQSNKQIVENILNELIGNKRVLKDIELVKREVKDE